MKKVTFFFGSLTPKIQRPNQKSSRKITRLLGSFWFILQKDLWWERKLGSKNGFEWGVCPLELPWVFPPWTFAVSLESLCVELRFLHMRHQGPVTWFFWHHFYRCIAEHLGSPIGDAPEKKCVNVVNCGEVECAKCQELEREWMTPFTQKSPNVYDRPTSRFKSLQTKLSISSIVPEVELRQYIMTPFRQIGRN